jgi:hypothetical protein
VIKNLKKKINANIMKNIVKRKTNNLPVILVLHVENMGIMQIIVGLINLHFLNHRAKYATYVENMGIMK